ncbi:MAG: flagellin [Anaerovoracaceae bacterium]|jgi:flagellin
MRINHNIAALNTYRQLTGNTAASSKSLEKLSSGLRINRAGDDAAGLAISEKMRGQIRGLDQASRNAQDSISMIQTAEGALAETHSILQRMRELAVQSANDTNTSNDRAEIQKEIDQLAIEVTRIANDTEFNTQKLVNGGISSSGLGENAFQIGANADQKLAINIGAMDAKTLGVSRDTLNGTGAGDISSATIATSSGDKLVKDASLTFQYAKVDVATAATITGTDAAVAITSDPNGTLNLKIDGAAISVTLNKDVTAADVVAAINTAANTALETTGIEYAKLNTGKLSITSNTTGSNSSVEILDTSTAQVLTDLKLSATSSVGQDIGETITISNGTDDQVVTITDSTATNLSVTSGNYSGLTINMADTKTLADLDSTNDKVTVGIAAATAATFIDGVTTDAVTKAGIDVSSRTAANDAITTIEAAITTVSAERSKLGSYQNRLEHTINNLGTTSENLSASESRIRDVDMAQEMMEFTKNNILSQAAQAMLAQANQQPQSVLQLLQ